MLRSLGSFAFTALSIKAIYLHTHTLNTHLVLSGSKCNTTTNIYSFQHICLPSQSQITQTHAHTRTQMRTHPHSNAYAVIQIFLKMSASNTYWPNDMTVMLGTAVYCQVLIVCLSPQEPQPVGGWWTTAFNHGKISAISAFLMEGLCHKARNWGLNKLFPLYL